MSISDPVVMPLAEKLMDCYAVEIAKVLVPPKYVQFRTGSTVEHLISMYADECCEGLAWVRVAGFYPTGQSFPDQASTAPIRAVRAGATSWSIVLEMGAVRCFPTPGPGEIPTAAQWLESTQAVMDDAAAMRRALCCFGEGRGNKMLPGQWQPLATEGGCCGGILPITVMGPACDCADAGPES